MIEPLDHAARQVAISPLWLSPFPYIIIEDIFPLDFYRRLRKEYPSDLEGMTVDGTCTTRYWKRSPICNDFRQHFGLAQTLATKFRVGGGIKVGVKARLARDLPDYWIAPHTDAPAKLVSIMFYLPETEGVHGTSIYVPKDGKLTSKESDGPGREFFDVAYTVPHKPNSAFAFLRTDNSWHGVEKAKRTGYRDSLIYMIYKVT